VDIQEGRFTAPVKEAYESYLQSRKFVYGDKEKDVCLMDIAVMGMRELRKEDCLTTLMSLMR